MRKGWEREGKFSEAVPNFWKTLFSFFAWGLLPQDKLDGDTRGLEGEIHITKQLTTGYLSVYV